MHAQLSEETSHSQQFEMIETRAFRQRLEAAIDALIATLDALDGDTDLEPDSDGEPLLGWTRGGDGQSLGAISHCDIAGGTLQPIDDECGELEHDDSDFEDTNDQEALDPDFEPSLARTESLNQAAIQGGDDDREAQWDEEEDFGHC